MTGSPGQAPAVLGEGWWPTPTTPFNELVGPFWQRGAGDALEFAVLPGSAHGNHLGIVHGGMVMTMADHALGLAVAASAGAATLVTIQLNVSFLGAGRCGAPLLARATVTRRSTMLYFVRGEISSPDGLVATAEGIWKAVRPRGRTGS